MFPFAFLVVAFVQRMTVRFKKRKGAILLGELSGRLSCQGGVTTAVCSVRPLSLATDEIVGKVRPKFFSFFFLRNLHGTTVTVSALGYETDIFLGLLFLR